MWRSVERTRNHDEGRVPMVVEIPESFFSFQCGVVYLYHVQTVKKVGGLS